MKHYEIPRVTPALCVFVVYILRPADSSQQKVTKKQNDDDDDDGSEEISKVIAWRTGL